MRPIEYLPAGQEYAAGAIIAEQIRAGMQMGVPALTPANLVFQEDAHAPRQGSVL